MLAAPIPEDEAQRLEALRAMHILDTMPEERFDRITRLAKRMFQTEISLISLVDTQRQWFKSKCGLPVDETARDISFCGHAIMAPGTLIVPNALADARFSDNPLVTGEPNIRFYAGQPLSAPNGTRIGTLCIIDSKPRAFSVGDRQSLQDLADIVQGELSTRVLAHTDALTELPNRRGFTAAATQRLSRATTPMTLVYLDLDDFKCINDTFGHHTGDEALRAFARALQASSTPADLCARLGGDEFGVLLSGSPARGAHFIEQVRAHLAQHTRPYALRFSAGMLPFHRAEHPSISALMAAGDVMMYADKRRRKQACAS